MKLLIAGDFCEKLRFLDYFKQGDFSELTPIRELTNSVDFSIVNFEFPIIFLKDSAIHKAGPNLGGSTCSVEAIKFMGFNVCTLANNHILDQGSANCIQTKDYLNSKEISTVGVGHNLKDAQKTLYLQKDNYTTALINCCENEFSIATEYTAGANPLNSITQYYAIIEAKKNADSVIVIVHGGNEHCQLPSKRMKEIYRFFIDIGADIVINHHQHCISGFEVYKDKPIFYGLGNFLFDHLKYRNENWNIGYMVILDLEKDKLPQYSLIPYKQATDKYMFKLCHGKDQNSFINDMNKLNSIINDDAKCQLKYEEWLKSNVTEYINLFEPYSSRITKKLFSIGILPSFINTKKLLKIINYLNCESHLDKLRFVITEKLNKTVSKKNYEV